MKYLILFALTGLLFTSCAPKGADQDKDLISPTSTLSTNGDSIMPLNTGSSAVEVAGLTKSTPGAVNVPQLNTGVAVAANGALNPEHGQPGHRCELAVGAPLNSSAVQPAATITPTTVNASAAPKAVIAPTKIATSSALNPEHGQPGHRCDISVGAPLNSKPSAGATPVANPVTNVVNASAPVALPAKAVNANGTKLNPAHGQPGHDCKVAVGEPLN